MATQQLPEITTKEGRLDGQSALCLSSGQDKVELRKHDDERPTLADVSIIMAGEALGHGFMIDEGTLETGVQALLGKTLPAYLTHEGAIYGDRLTKEIGHFSGFYRDGDRIRAQQFVPLKSFLEHRKSEADTLFELAEQTPENFGISIVPEGEIVWPMDDGGYEPFDGEMTPPEGATAVMPSLRIERVYSADFVDAPAANVGLFRQNNNDSKEENNTMSKDTETKEVLELKAVNGELSETVTALKDAISKKDEYIQQIVDKHQAELAEARDSDRNRIKEILEIGKRHKHEDLALEKALAGESVEDFRTELLNAYAEHNKPFGIKSDEANTGEAPASEKQFVATYRVLSAKDLKAADEYWAEHGTKFGFGSKKS